MQVLSNHLFIIVDILSGKTTGEEIMAYEKDAEQFHQAKIQAENLGIPFNDEAPTEPDFDLDYRTQKWNIGSVTILDYYVEYDEKRECEIIVVDFIQAGVFNQYNIRISESEWENLLLSLGATINSNSKT